MRPRSVWAMGCLIAILFFNHLGFSRINLDMTPSGLEIDEIQYLTDQLMDDYIGQFSVGAAVVIISDGEIILSKSYGYSDLDGSLIDPEQSVFEYASITKIFTWTAVMQQVELGHIDLNANIMNYLPSDFCELLQKSLRYQEPITMLHLMNHTAGFEEVFFDGDYNEEILLSNTLEEALLKQMPQQVYRPGSKQAYSNFGAALAGYIVECVTSQTLYDYLEENIFDVLEMSNTVADPRYTQYDHIISNKVNGHICIQETVFADAPWTYVNTYPDGSINGTAMDLSRFIIALMQEDCPLFSHDSTRDQMFSITYSLHPDLMGCAHGFWNFSSTDNFFHDGGHIGFTGIAAFDPTQQFAVIVLSNTRDDYYTTYGLAEILMGRDREVSVSYADLPDVSEVTGVEFVSTRRPQSDFTALYPFIGGEVIKAEASGENTIFLRGLEYAQVLPYMYRLIDDKDNPVIRAAYDTVYFIVQDGDVVGFTYGGCEEYDKVSLFHSSVSLRAQAIFVACAVFFFLICVVINIIQTIRRKTFEPYSIFCVWGLLLVVNQVVLLSRMLFAVTYSFPSSAYQIHIIINQGILLLSVFLSLWFVFSKKKNTAISKKRIVHRIVSIVVYVLFVVVLAAWGFFSKI